MHLWIPEGVLPVQAVKPRTGAAIGLGDYVCCKNISML